MRLIESELLCINYIVAVGATVCKRSVGSHEVYFVTVFIKVKWILSSKLESNGDGDGDDAACGRVFPVSLCRKIASKKPFS